MWTSRHAGLLVALTLLGTAARSHAECAWILWNDEVRYDYATRVESRLWHTVASASTKPACETRLREEISQVTRPDLQPKDVRFKVLGDAVQVLYEQSSRVQTFRYVCLPSTVDPRAPRSR